MIEEEELPQIVVEGSPLTKVQYEGTPTSTLLENAGSQKNMFKRKRTNTTTAAPQLSMCVDSVKPSTASIVDQSNHQHKRKGSQLIDLSKKLLESSEKTLKTKH